jgi:hypothetical protein
MFLPVFQPPPSLLPAWALTVGLFSGGFETGFWLFGTRFPLSARPDTTNSTFEALGFCLFQLAPDPVELLNFVPIDRVEASVIASAPELLLNPVPRSCQRVLYPDSGANLALAEDRKARRIGALASVWQRRPGR